MTQSDLLPFQLDPPQEAREQQRAEPNEPEPWQRFLNEKCPEKQR